MKSLLVFALGLPAFLGAMKDTKKFEEYPVAYYPGMSLTSEEMWPNTPPQSEYLLDTKTFKATKNSFFQELGKCIWEVSEFESRIEEERTRMVIKDTNLNDVLKNEEGGRINFYKGKEIKCLAINKRMYLTRRVSNIGSRFEEMTKIAKTASAESDQELITATYVYKDIFYLVNTLANDEEELYAIRNASTLCTYRSDIYFYIAKFLQRIEQANAFFESISIKDWYFKDKAVKTLTMFKFKDLYAKTAETYGPKKLNIHQLCEKYRASNSDACLRFFPMFQFLNFMEESQDKLKNICNDAQGSIYDSTIEKFIISIKKNHITLSNVVERLGKVLNFPPEEYTKRPSPAKRSSKISQSKKIIDSDSSSEEVKSRQKETPKSNDTKKKVDVRNSKAKVKLSKKLSSDSSSLSSVSIDSYSSDASTYKGSQAGSKTSGGSRSIKKERAMSAIKNFFTVKKA